MNLDFMEIGTSDFDSLSENSTDETEGISIEPLQVYLDNLPEKKGVIKVCKGVSDTRINNAKIYYIPPRIIEHLNLPNLLKVCNSFFKEHVQHKPYQVYVVCDYVKVVKFIDLIEEFRVSKIRLLKIDCEGHDLLILNSIYEDYVNGKLYVLPDQIDFECYLGNQEEPPYCKHEDFKGTITNIKSIGYGFEQKDEFNYTLRMKS